MIVFGQFLAFSMNAVIAHMQGGPTVTLTGDAVDASGHVLGHAGTSVAWETVQAAVNIADVAGTGNGLTWRYMLILCSLPANRPVDRYPLCARVLALVRRQSAHCRGYRLPQACAR